MGSEQFRCRGPELSIFHTIAISAVGGLLLLTIRRINYSAEGMFKNTFLSTMKSISWYTISCSDNSALFIMNRQYKVHARFVEGDNAQRHEHSAGGSRKSCAHFLAS